MRLLLARRAGESGARSRAEHALWWVYFGVSAYALNWAEAAMLARLPAAPSAYDPLTHLRLAKQRQRHVLDQLVVNHYLSAAQATAAYRQRLPLSRG